MLARPGNQDSQLFADCRVFADDGQPKVSKMNQRTMWSLSLVLTIVFSQHLPPAQAQNHSVSEMPGYGGNAVNGREGEPGEQPRRAFGRLGQRFGKGAGGGLRNFGFRNPQSLEGRWSGQGQPQLIEVNIEGTKRRYYLYRPASAKLPAPLVLAFHGGGGTAEGTDKLSGGLAKLADQQGFIVAYPDAIDKHWNDGRPDLAKTYYDDVGFISKVIDDLTQQNIADSKRVYATGISNGGFFSQYLAIQLPNKIAAVATVAASVSKTFLDLSVTPVPVMMLLGTKDTLIPWDGGRVGGKILLKKRGEVIPGRQSLEFWLTKNHNTSKPIRSELPDKDPNDGSRVSVEQYGEPDSANQVVLYEISGGGHTWPAGQQYLPQSIIGPVCRDFDGNEAIWKFFEKHAIQ